MNTDNNSVPVVAKVDSESDVFDHRDHDGQILKATQKFLKESGREDDLLILNFLQGN